MARIPLSDDACDGLVASRDPIDAARLCDGAVVDASRRLRDELLAELADEPSSCQPAARRRRRRGFRAARRGVAAAAAIAAVAIVGVLAMGGSLPAGGDHDGQFDVPAASAAVVLDRAAQAAIRSASVAPGRGQYGFVKVETGSVGGTGQAVAATQPNWNVWLRTSEVKSDWYTANGSGRERIVRTSTTFLMRRDRAIARAHGMTLAQLTATFPRVIDGAFSARAAQSVGFLPYWQIGRLPTQPAALRRALERLLLASAGAAQGSLMRQMRADPAGLFGPISQFLFLPTSPQLRAALFRVLAGLPGVQLLGHQRDRLGRSGIAVAVTEGGPDRVREELLFDPATSNLLQTQTVELRMSTRSASGGPSIPAMPAGTVAEYTDFLSRGVVNSITRLPGGRHLPLKPAGGSR
jgi:hypothetical protein